MATWEIIRCMSSVLAPMQEELTKSACVEGSVCDTRLSMNVSRTLAVSLIGSGIVWKSMPHASVLVLIGMEAEEELFDVREYDNRLTDDQVRALYGF